MTRTNNFMIMFLSFILALSFSVLNDMKIEKITHTLSRDKYIYESFLNACNSNKIENLYIWQKECKKNKNLDYIAWCNAQDIMILPQEKEFTLICASWESSINKIIVFHKINSDDL